MKNNDIEIVNSKKIENKIPKKKTLFKKILVSGIIILILGVIMAIGGLIYLFGSTDKLTKEDFEFKKLTSFFYDINEKEITSVFDSQNRIVVSLKDMPAKLPKAFISIEDERFEKHHGIDFKRTAGAVLNYILKGKSDYGGSTITQQLVKNVTGDKENTPSRKLREQIRAIQLENMLSKDQIIELYLNTIYLGNGVYGVQTASRNYFDKDAKDLTIAECALIAGITQSPESNNPFKYPERIEKRQKVVLGKMKQLGYINDKEYQEAINQKMAYKKGSVIGNSKKKSYFIEAVIEQVTNELVAQKKMSKGMALNNIYSNGYKIYTTMDPVVQDVLEAKYKDMSLFPLDKKYNDTPESAMVIMDQSKGYVVGIVGGVGEKTIDFGLNRATSSQRQLGSCIKPLAVYGPGVNEKIFTAGSVFDDVPLSLKVGTTVWTPKNWYAGYQGLSTVRTAVEQSMNIIAVKALNNVTINTAYDYLKKLGFTTIGTDDKYPAALALGGLDTGVSPLEVTGAYSTIANEGMYLKPRLFTKVVDAKGNIVIENKPTPKQVFSEEAAYITLDLMKEVTKGARGTGKAAKLASGIPVAAKTGTTTSDKDRWFVGITPYYTGVVWYGFDQPKTINAASNPGTKIWKLVMDEIHKGKKVTDFAQPENVIRVAICKDSGDLAGEYCSKDPRESRVYTELFIKGTQPKTTCTVHTKIKICSESNKVSNEYCPLDKLVEKVMINRKIPYIPLNNIFPQDWAFQMPSDICTIHTKPPVVVVNPYENVNIYTTPGL